MMGQLGQTVNAALEQHLQKVMTAVQENNRQNIRQADEDVTHFVQYLATAIQKYRLPERIGTGTPSNASFPTILQAVDSAHMDLAPLSAASSSAASPATSAQSRMANQAFTSAQEQDESGLPKPFKFDRNAETVEQVWRECQRYKEAKKAADLVGYTKESRSEERYINDRLVVAREIIYKMASEHIAVQKAIVDLTKEHEGSGTSIVQFMKS
ncbi:hypothetical protein BGX28_001918, partial [Mortierella sp. GBA30]